MRLEQLNPILLPEERATFPVFGGDGVVLVRGITWGQKTALAELPKAEQIPQLLAWTVRDEDGAQLMSTADWGVFCGGHQDDALELASIAKRVCGYDGEEVKKD